MTFFRAFVFSLFIAATARAATAPVTLSIIGKGSVKGATNGQSLTIDKAYTLTATPASGFVFRGWSGSTNSPKASLSFKMQPDVALTATFEDMTRPTVAITSPKPGQRLLAPQFTMTGTAKDNDRIQQVRVRVNGGEWSEASPSNPWNAPVTFKAGLNKLEAVATDFANRNSTTGAVKMTYVVFEPVHFGVDGPGKISPAPASSYEIDKTYTVTAVPKPGCVFEGWSGSTNTASRALKFQMRSGLAFTAKFRDIAKPTITLTTASKIETPAGEFAIGGKATDNISVAKVFWSANGGQWIEAGGTTLWSQIVPLEPGPNRIRVYSEDTTGNVSPTREIFIMSVRELARVYFPMHAGDQWTYLGPLGRVTKQFSTRDDGAFIQRDVGEPLEVYYKHSPDFSQLINLGLADGTFSLTHIPPIAELDQKYLAHGGSWTVLTMALLYDSSLPHPEMAVQMRYSFKITPIAKVIVPAGEFTDCRRVDLSVSAYIPGKGWDNSVKGAYVIAPNVGMIQNGLYRKLANGTFQFGAWENLEHASVDGIPIGLSPAAPVQLAESSSASTSSVTESNSGIVLGLSNPSGGAPPPPIAASPSVVVVPDVVRPSEFVALQVIGVTEEGFEFLFPTQPGRNYRVEASYDLVNWGGLISSFTAEEGEYRIVEPEIGDVFRFYRVIAE